MDKFSYLGNGDVNAVEELYNSYKRDPESVEQGWRSFFEGFEFFQKNYDQEAIPQGTLKEFRVIDLINAYRTRGHLFTLTNPVRERRKYTPTLDIGNFGLQESDLDTTFQAGVELGIGPSKLRDIVEHLKTTYCRSIGVEYAYIRKTDVVSWIRQRIEPSRNLPAFSKEVKKKILEKLNEAVVFESFLHKKFVGQKRDRKSVV